LKETDLYHPVKQFLESQGYEVKGEINNCDVVALRGDEEPVIIELKLTLNLNVILQVVDRLKISSKVYVGVPRDCSILKKNRKRVLKLFKMLGIGLMTVDFSRKKNNAEVLTDPVVFKPRKYKRHLGRLLGEFANRVGDPAMGGSDRRKGILTAYRQRALRIANYLMEHGATKASILKDELDDPKARDILYRDVYGWFDRLGRGVYNLSPRGEREIKDW
jgi:hypothetical protein